MQAGKNPPSSPDRVRDLEECLSSLCDPNDQSFYDGLVGFLCSDENFYGDELRDVLADPMRSDLHLKAWWGLVFRARRIKNFVEFRDLVRQVPPNLEAEPLVGLMRAEMLLRGAPSDSELDEALHLSELGLAAIPIPAVFLTRIDVILTVLDRGSSGPKAAELDREAERLCENGIAKTLGQYAKFYASRARLNLYRKWFEAALSDIDHAIEVERSISTDYAIRLMDFQIIRMQIVAGRQIASVRKEQAEAVAEFRESRRQVIEVLGLLAAVIAFVITAAQQGRSLALADSGFYFVITSGSLILVFSAYYLLFASRELHRRALVPISLGSIMVIGPLLYAVLR
jgi:hypothetical protein